MLGKIVGVILIMVAAFSSSAQVPAPPSLPDQSRLSRELVLSIETKNLTAYSALLSDVVHVFEDGREVAKNKNDWINTFGRKLSADGVVFKLSPGFSSTGRLLFVEYFSSAGSWGGGVSAHCCWSYDAVAYDLADGKVVAIRRLRGGDTKLDERGSPAK